MHVRSSRLRGWHVRARPFARELLGTGLIVAAILTWFWRAAYRGYEALVAGYLSGIATRSHEVTIRPRSTFYVNVGSPKIFGLVVTPECTSAIVTTIFLTLTGLLIAATRLTLGRVVLAGTLAVAFFVVANIVRLVLIAVASDRWGLKSGYHWSHVWVGSVITVFGGGAAVLLFLVILTGPMRISNRTPSGGRHVR